jgi:hypothetical protein
MWRVITNSDSLSRKRYRYGKLPYTLHTAVASPFRVAIRVRMRDSLAEVMFCKGTIDD